MAAYAFALSLSHTLLALILERQGYSPAVIGVNAAMGPLGTILFAPFTPLIARKIGATPLMAASLLVCAAIFAGLALGTNIVVWFLLRFVFGAAANAVFVVSETWINQLAPRHLRGRIIAVYAVAASIGYAGGPSIIAVVGSAGLLPFAIAIAAVLLGLAVVIAARDQLPAITGGSVGSFLRFLPLAPSLLVGVGMIGLFDQTIMSLLPIYALENGMTEARAALAVGVLIGGNIALQYPIGWIADRLPRRAVRLGLAILTAIGAISLPFLIDGPGLWPMLVLWGSVAFGIYTVSLAELGDRFDGEALFAGNAAFSMMWGLGGLLGPMLSGPLMTVAGPNGLPLSLAFWFLVLALLILRGWQRAN